MIDAKRAAEILRWTSIPVTDLRRLDELREATEIAASALERLPALLRLYEACSKAKLYDTGLQVGDDFKSAMAEIDALEGSPQ